ncbi:hypothetical protein BRARA_I04788 [Brassica rapa]|uniref:Uncharacterized protein n=1 Tax=Brassica campestris TaxID=3711 RepID=A0A397Y8X7_BRACM|nr:hypothetical protein BRARA_I04788 [Brassica rapa]
MQQLKERLEKDLIEVLCHLSLDSLICKLSSVVVKMTKICSSSAIFFRFRSLRTRLELIVLTSNRREYIGINRLIPTDRLIV